MEELVPFNVRTVQWVDFNLTTKMLTWHYYGVLCFLKIVCTWTSETSDNLEACSEKNLKEGWVRFDKEKRNLSPLCSLVFEDPKHDSRILSTLMTRRRLLKIKHCAAPQFEIIQHFTCIISFTVFLIVTAVKEKVEERRIDVLFGGRYTVFIRLEEGITLLISVP